MISKINKYIKEKILIWLGINQINSEVKRNYREFNAFRKISHEDIGMLNNQIHNINKTYSIGVDVGVKDHRNWAVICIEGKPNYVKFVDLNSRGVREVQRFLRQFEGSRNVIDAPYNMDFIFSDEKLWDR